MRLIQSQWRARELPSPSPPCLSRRRGKLSSASDEEFCPAPDAHPLESCNWKLGTGRCHRMNRIVERFARLKQAGKKGLVVYVGAGDPTLEATRGLALALDLAGVDVLELGVPFSDPLADGLVNQLAAQRGLESGTTPPKVLETVAAIRRDAQVPIVLYLYYNLAHRYGVEPFIRDASQAGVDGLLALD